MPEVPERCECGGWVQLIRHAEQSLVGEREHMCMSCGKSFGSVLD